MRIRYQTALEKRTDAAGKRMLERVRAAARAAFEDYDGRSQSWWLAYLFK